MSIGLVLFVLSVGGFDISLFFVFFAPAAEKRHWLHSKVYISHAPPFFDVKFISIGTFGGLH